MKPLAIILLGLVAALPACDSASAPEPLTASPQHGATMTAVSAIQGSVHSSGETLPAGWCDQAAGIARSAVSGTGVGRHTGRFQMTATNCLNPVTGIVTGGVATIVSANGDELHMTYTGHVLPGVMPPAFDLSYVITGGTGRFASATGELEVRVQFNSPTTWTSSGSGWLEYDASDRAAK